MCIRNITPDDKKLRFFRCRNLFFHSSCNTIFVTSAATIYSFLCLLSMYGLGCIERTAVKEPLKYSTTCTKIFSLVFLCQGVLLGTFCSSWNHFNMLPRSLSIVFPIRIMLKSFCYHFRSDDHQNVRGTCRIVTHGYRSWWNLLCVFIPF